MTCMHMYASECEWWHRYYKFDNIVEDKFSRVVQDSSAKGKYTGR